jgi:DNA-binding HxlR family transcriptional regulator
MKDLHKLPQSAFGCPMHALLQLLMGQWTAYILWILQTQGPTRFGALKRSIPGVSAKMLTERLRQLETAGIIYRKCVASRPPQVTYGLALRGTELTSVLETLNQIAQKWAQEDFEHTTLKTEKLHVDMEEM